ncbi:MAG: hypothetical protein EA427_06580 [Spirochaetaceae bacterium]|nr:MAG: hypothetical protein EA427_06580 [Spirochaetaceae bacterium]
MTIWVALALIAVGILAIYLEFFVPAFGVIGIGGVIVIATAVVLGFRNLPDTQAIIVLLTALLVTPLTLIVLLRRFSRSFLGRRLILNTQLGVGSANNATDSGSAGSNLVGMSGITTTPLHPAGFATIGEKRCSVVTNGEYLPQGKEVVVAGHFGSRIVVREKVTPSSEGGSHDV